jgi:hypothetical protein
MLFTDRRIKSRRCHSLYCGSHAFAVSSVGGTAISILLYILPIGQAAAQAAQAVAPPVQQRINPKAGTFKDPSGNNFVFEASSADNPQAKNATDQPGNISGIWLNERQSRPETPRPPTYGPAETRTMEGDPLPLTPWAAAIYSKRLKDTAAGTPFASTMAACLPDGMPAMAVGEPYPIQIIQSPGQVTTIHELMYSHRLIFLDEKLPEDPNPGYMGTSAGHWEGDTLVVTTVGIRDTTTMGGGIPHSEDLRTVERIRRLDPDTLEVIMTLEDPKAYTRPWRYRATSKLLPPTVRPIEYICENQRNSVDDQGRSGADVKARRGPPAKVSAQPPQAKRR